MARLPRLTLAGYPHHVIQRGNNRQVIFVDR
jgi:putative transposase